MKKETQGNKQMPDFDKLTDRVIAEPSASPTFVMKTNLDPNSSLEDNPYVTENSKQHEAEFRKYFEEK